MPARNSELELTTGELAEVGKQATDYLAMPIDHTVCKHQEKNNEGFPKALDRRRTCQTQKPLITLWS